MPTKTHRLTRRTLLACLGASFWLGTPAAHATDYPSKPVKITVGFAPGGAADILARQLGTKLMAQTGQSLIVDNRVGATGTIATMSTLQSPADGYNLMLASQSTMVLAPILYSSIKFDTLRDFVPVARLVNLPLILVVHPSVEAHTVEQVLQLAKARPMHYASAGAGGPQHIAGEYFKYLAQTDIDHVPYNGEATAVNDVLAGQVPMMFANLPVVAPHIKAGKLRAVAITSPERHADFPDLPAMRELPGMEQFDVETWYGIFAPAKTPEAVVRKLEAEIQQALATEEFATSLSAQGYRIVGSSSADFTSFIQQEIPRWSALAAETQMKVD